MTLLLLQLLLLMLLPFSRVRRAMRVFRNPHTIHFHMNWLKVAAKEDEKNHNKIS